MLHDESSWILLAKEFLVYFIWPLIVTLLKVCKPIQRTAIFTDFSNFYWFSLVSPNCNEPHGEFGENSEVGETGEIMISEKWWKQWNRWNRWYQWKCRKPYDTATHWHAFMSTPWTLSVWGQTGYLLCTRKKWLEIVEFVAIFRQEWCI